ncbi:MAG: exodeoxyribonuclease VII small subunit [Cytophagales bacterium]|nr:exodeoxyribonuclease VII small subunit [Cytophagales bacterium]
MTYSEAQSELEAILNAIEHEEPELDELLRLVNRAGELITWCKAKLRHSEEDLEKILKKFDQES